MKQNFTVLHIQMLLHYHAIAEPYAERDPDHAGSEAVRKYRIQLLNWGYLQGDDGPSSYRPTRAGENYIERIKEMS